MKNIYFFVLLSFVFSMVDAQYVTKVTSINYYGYNGLNPHSMVVFKGKIYFLGTNERDYVDKLMYTDGTEAGVTVVKQIDSVKQYPSLNHLTVLNDLLIFDNYSQLWKSDGTTGGTSLLKNMRVAGNYEVLNTKVYFSGDASGSGTFTDQLWQTDGTVGGTVLFKTINPSGAANISGLFAYGGKIYFRADSANVTGQLWVTDGTVPGTHMLKKFCPSCYAYPNNFTVFNNKLYFGASDGVNGSQVWATDGTTAGTVKITNINSTHGGMSPTAFTVFNAELFFSGIDSSGFYQLWKTDGTPNNATKLKAAYTYNSSGFNPNSMAVHNNKLYMAGLDTVTNTTQLWTTDGTPQGTTQVTHFSFNFGPSKLFSFQSKLIMTGTDTLSKQMQLWATDGTEAGTTCPTPPDTWGQYPFYPWEKWVPYNGAVYFRGAYSYFADYQLCRYSEQPMGVTELMKQNLSVYPNPTSGILTVELPKSGDRVTIEVYNCIGVLILKQATNTSATIDLTNQPQGLYILKVMNNNQPVALQKIIKE